MLLKFTDKLTKLFKIKNITHFIKLIYLSDSEKYWLGRKGYSWEKLSQLGRDDRSSEKTYQAQSGDPPESGAAAGSIPAFQQTLIQTGCLFSPCPKCGKIISSNQSFCIFVNSHDQPIFYRFNCCEELYLVVVRSSPQTKLGVYFPDNKLFVSFEDYKTKPHREKYYGVETCEYYVSILLSYLKRSREKVSRYISWAGPKKIIGLSGFEGNHGHHIFDEITALQYLVDNHHLREKMSFMVGPKDYLDLANIFPEIEFSHFSKDYPDTSDLPYTLFEHLLINNLLAVRPTLRGPLREKTAQRIIEVAKTKVSEEFLAIIHDSAKCFPLVWVTLRSHTRCWVSQIDGLVKIIREIHADFPGCGVVFDGIKAEQPTLEAILQGLPAGIKSFNGLHCNFYETLIWTNYITFFIAPLGNGTLFTSITNKPGIVHTHADWSSKEPYCINNRENGVLAIPVTGTPIYAKDKDIFSYDYELDWKSVLHEARTLINKM